MEYEYSQSTPYNICYEIIDIAITPDKNGALKYFGEAAIKKTKYGGDNNEPDSILFRRILPSEPP
jgi:hypothetical protein